MNNGLSLHSVRAGARIFSFYAMKVIFAFLLVAVAGRPACAQCDSTLRPIVFVHGFLASGDTWSEPIHRFQQAGHCADRLAVFDWNSVGGSAKTNEAQLAAFIDRVLARTGAEQVDLVGHSAGGSLCRSMLMDTIRARKVARYIHIGSRKWSKSNEGFPNDRCLNIYSAGDRVAGTSGGAVDGALNIDLKDKDHYEVATSEESFRAMYRFLRGKEPRSAPVPASTLYLSGKAVQLGDNAPLRGARIRIYVLHRRTGSRKGGRPVGEGIADESGAWGPLNLRPGLPYEIELVPQDTGQRTLSYFYPAPTRSDAQVYLRGFPQGNMVASLLGKLPARPDQSVLVLYSATRAMVGGRDSVTVNGVPVCSPTLTPATRTVISSFIYDDGDGSSSATPLKQYAGTPFLGGTDLLLPAAGKKSILIYCNGQRLRLPARPSKERILLAVIR